MKKMLFLGALLAVLVLSSTAFASYTEVAVYMPNSAGVWASPPSDDLGLHAKAFISGPENGICDKKDWVETITNHVTVSQWINYSFGGTRWDWQIRKPGTFAADCIEFAITSNDDVDVAFDGFADLQPLIHTDGSAAPIAVSYNYGTPGADAPPASGWLTAAQLNDADFQLSYAEVKDGLTKKLWNKIVIPESQRACDYEDSGTVTLSLTDVKYFINPADGMFNDALPSANPLAL